MNDNQNTPDDVTDPNVIAIERDTTHPYEDFSDLYANIFDNPQKHGEDLKWAAETGHRDVFEKLLPKVHNYGEVAAIAFIHGNASWAQEIVDKYPDNDFQEYFEELLKAGDVEKALALWGTTDTTLSKTSLAFEKASYDRIAEDYRSEFREMAEDYLTEKQLVDRVVRSDDAAWVQRQIEAGLDFVLDADQIGMLVDQNYLGTIQALSKANPQLHNDFLQAARSGNPALFNQLNPTEPAKSVAPEPTTPTPTPIPQITPADKRGFVLTARVKNIVHAQKAAFAVAPLTPKTLKEKLADKATKKREQTVFRQSLQSSNQLQNKEPLCNGATHVIEKSKKGPLLVRKRFSAT